MMVRWPFFACLFSSSAFRWLRCGGSGSLAGIQDYSGSPLGRLTSGSRRWWFSDARLAVSPESLQRHLYDRARSKLSVSGITSTELACSASPVSRSAGLRPPTVTRRYSCYREPSSRAPAYGCRCLPKWTRPTLSQAAAIVSGSPLCLLILPAFASSSSPGRSKLSLTVGSEACDISK